MDGSMYAIGEFSKITGITIKALRHYHERGLLEPRVVDDATGYRYYDAHNVEKARGIVYLRQMMFSLDEIKNLLDNFGDDSDIVDFLEEHREEIAGRIEKMQKVVISIDEIVRREREAKKMVSRNAFEVEKKELATILVASIRWKGKYSDCGSRLSTLYKKMGRYGCGKAMNLYYDDGYREDDADIETCLPVRKGKEIEGITVRELEGGKAMTLIHKGPYDQLGRSYEKIVKVITENGLKIKAPSREVYVKGPGMIFTGNPKNYLTEIQFLVEG
jgi:DNA-binding transcriptional MerR regulator